MSIVLPLIRPDDEDCVDAKMPQGKHKKLKCDICGKEYRSDYLKKHKEICKKKVLPASRHDKRTSKKSVRNFKKPVVKGNGIEKYFSSTEHETTVSELDSTYIISSESESEEKASDEVMQRLRDMGMKLKTNVISKCEWCSTDVIDLKHHQKTCNMKKVPCFRCKKEYPTYFIKAHFQKCKGGEAENEADAQDNGCDKKKKRKKSKKERNKKDKDQKGKDKGKGKAKAKKSKGDDSGDDEKKARIRKGNFFKVNCHGARKYKLLKRFITKDEEKKRYVFKDWIKQIAIGNEYGSGPRPHAHCHLAIATKQKMNFDQFKKKWKSCTKIKIADVERAKHWNTDVRYVTKEDYRPIISNIDWDLTSVLCRAYIAANKYKTFFPTMYPYCNLNAFQKSCFKVHFEDFQAQIRNDAVIQTYNDLTLRPWQEKFMRFLDWHDHPREIIWIIDQVGNSGKTYISFYLQDLFQALRVPNVSTRDFAFAYNFEKIVCFDYDRDNQEHINYGLLEDLKNGALWSPKYESKCKNFRDMNVKVVCFANYSPDYSKLSHDRWRVFNLVEGKLKRVDVPKTEPLEIIVTEESLDIPESETVTLNFVPFEVFEQPMEHEEENEVRAFPVGQYVEPKFIDSNLIEIH